MPKHKNINFIAKVYIFSLYPHPLLALKQNNIIIKIFLYKLIVMAYHSIQAELPSAPLPIGYQCELDIVGRNREDLPFGWVKHRYGPKPIRVFIGDASSGRDIEKEMGSKPGDHVIVRIDGYGPRSAYATVVDNTGPFLDTIDPRDVMLTGQSMHDARDAVSNPDKRGGFLGVYAIVKQVKHEYEDQRRVRVGIQRWGTGKTGRYYIIAKAVDHADERNTEKEIYVAQWAGGADPDYNDINSLPGVPRDFSSALFFGHGNRKYIIKMSGRQDASLLDPVSTVDLYREMTGRRFRLALGTEDSMDSLMYGIHLSPLGLTAEAMPKPKNNYPYGPAEIAD